MLSSAFVPPHSSLIFPQYLAAIKHHLSFNGCVKEYVANLLLPLLSLLNAQNRSELLCRWAKQQAKQYRRRVINGIPKQHTWRIFPYSWWKQSRFFFPLLILLHFHTNVTEARKAPGTTVTLCYPHQPNEKRAEAKAFRRCNLIQLPHAGHVVTFKYGTRVVVQQIRQAQAGIQDMAVARQLQMLRLSL